MDTIIAIEQKKDKGSIAAAFVAANERKAGQKDGKVRHSQRVEPAEEPGNSMGNKMLVDVRSLLGDVLKSPEQLELEKKIAHENKEWAENAAEGLQKIRSNIRSFDEIVLSGGILNTNQKAQLEKLREAERQITSAGDEAIQKHREFAEFLAKVRAATPDLKRAEEFVLEAVTDGRYHKASDIEVKRIMSLMRGNEPFPQGLIFLNGVNYLPTVEGDAKSKGQMALEAELTRFVRQSIKAHKDIEEAGISDDLRGLQQGRIGKYRIIFEERINPISGKKHYAGNGIVEVAIRKMDNGPIDQVRIIVPIKGDGSLKCFSKLAEKDFYVSASWYTEKDLSAKRISDDLRDEAEKFLSCLKAGVAAFYNRENGGGDKRFVP